MVFLRIIMLVRPIYTATLRIASCLYVNSWQFGRF